MQSDKNSNANNAEEEWKDDDFLTFENDNEESVNKSNEGVVPDNRKDTDAKNDPVGSRQIRNTSFSSKNNIETTSYNNIIESPPWMCISSSPCTAVPSSTTKRRRIGFEQHSRRPSSSPLVKLHNEIVNFVTLMEPQPEEMKERQKLVKDVTDLIHDTFGANNCKVDIFGSQATGLFLPSSDIDFVIILNQDDKTNAKGTTTEKKTKRVPNYEKTVQKKNFDQEEIDAYNIQEELDISSPYAKLGDAFRTKWRDKLSYLEVLENTRIPIVKFTHKESKLSADISINQPSGPIAAELMKRFLDAMPPLKPLTFVLKYFIAARGLNEPYSGGIGSYMLQLMIVSFLQHRERELYNKNQGCEMNLGSLLLDFFELYGVDFNYALTGISVRSDGHYFSKGEKGRSEYFWQPARPQSLAMENPLDPSMDVGKVSFRISLIQKSFDVAFHILLAHLSEPAVETTSILEKIIPPTEEMEKRAVIVSGIDIKEINKLKRPVDHYDNTDLSC